MLLVKFLWKFIGWLLHAWKGGLVKIHSTCRGLPGYRLQVTGPRGLSHSRRSILTCHYCNVTLQTITTVSKGSTEACISNIILNTAVGTHRTVRCRKPLTDKITPRRGKVSAKHRFSSPTLLLLCRRTQCTAVVCSRRWLNGLAGWERSWSGFQNSICCEIQGKEAGHKKVARRAPLFLSTVWSMPEGLDGEAIHSSWLTETIYYPHRGESRGRNKTPADTN